MPIEVRVTELERRVGRLEDGRPDVVAERVAHLTEAVHAMRAEHVEQMREVRGDVAALRHALIGFLAAFALASAGTVVAIFTFLA